MFSFNKGISLFSSNSPSALLFLPNRDASTDCMGISSSSSGGIASSFTPTIKRSPDSISFCFSPGRLYHHILDIAFLHGRDHSSLIFYLLQDLICFRFHIVSEILDKIGTGERIRDIRYPGFVRDDVLSVQRHSRCKSGWLCVGIVQACIVYCSAACNSPGKGLYGTSCDIVEGLLISHCASGCMNRYQQLAGLIAFSLKCFFGHFRIHPSKSPDFGYFLEKPGADAYKFIREESNIIEIKAPLIDQQPEKLFELAISTASACALLPPDS